MKCLSLIFVAVLLAGCGGGGADAALAVPGADQAPVPPPPGDTFTSALVALVRSTPESTEADEIDGKVLALPDDGEPVAVE